MGFNSTVQPLLNGGDFFSGDNFALSANVTPIFNEMNGTMSQQKISMKPGSWDLGELGSIKLLNGQD